MKKLLAAFVLLCLFAAGCSSVSDPAQELKTEPDSDETSCAVIYFSATGNTKHVAELIANEMDADLIELEAKEPYTDTDLNYGDEESRTSLEQNDDSSRPELKSLPDVQPYSTIYLGYPIWWGNAPRILYTFVESADLDGKTIIPFCTSGSSSIGSSAENLAALADEGIWLDGTRFGSNPSEEEISSFTDR